MKTRQRPWRFLFAGIVVALFAALAVGEVFAVQGTPLPGNLIPQFVDPLPDLDLSASGILGLDTIVAGPAEIQLNMRTFKANIMPSTFVPANGQAYSGTWTFGYVQDATAQPGLRETPVGPVIVASRGTPTQIRYVNNLEASDPALPASDPASTIHWRDWTDQSLHSAFHQAVGQPMPTAFDTHHYLGPVLAVPHLHGAEDPAVIDGGPEAWFASNVPGPDILTTFVTTGPAYYTGPDTAGGGTNPAQPNEAIYRYPNTQQAGPLWFHDHLLGGTRLNATFAGLAGAYLLTDPGLTLPAGLHPAGMVNTDGTNLRLLTPLVIQDRMFDTDGQLFFPNVGVNPEHPYWVPEFVGDVIVVNGKVWPFMSVERQRYRFFLINGSNSRPYNMWLQDQNTGVKGPPMWVIATDGGYLDTPVKVDPGATGKDKKAGVVKALMMMPGERYEIVVDFNDPAWVARAGTGPVNLVLRNDAATVNGNPNPKTTGKIMLFQVAAANPLAAADTSYDPASGIAIRSGNPIVRLPGAPGGPAITTGIGGNVDVTRLLTLNEVPGPGGPLEALVNNSKWGGLRTSDLQPIIDAQLVNNNWLTEFPNEGAVEVWEFVNLTADSHPIHLHAIQFQLIDRQAFNVTRYTAVYDAAFPTGVFQPGDGPPNAYNTPNAAGAVGGNPDVTPFLRGAASPPLAHEAGWKDTVIMHPGERTRIAARWAPQDVALGTAGTFAYAPDAPVTPGGPPGVYVWHCHITDHEDNEMMRPDVVVSAPGAVRTYNQGTDF